MRRIWRVVYWGLVIWGAWGILMMLRRAPAPLVTVNPEAAQSAEKKLQELATPAAGSLSPAEPQQIKLTEEEVNSFLSSRLMLAGGEAGAAAQGIGSVRDFKVTFSGDHARIFALFTVAGKDFTLQMEGRLAAQDGYFRFEPTSGKLGELTLPQSALEAFVSRLMNDPQAREGFRLPPEIRDVHVENGELVIVRQ